MLILTASGMRGTGNEASVSSAYHYLVYVDGNKVRHHVADPLAAIHAAEQAMDDDPEQSVVIVVLDDEEAGYTPELYAKRPFMTAPDVQAAEAELAAKMERDPGAPLPKGRSVATPSRSMFVPDAALVGGEPREAKPSPGIHSPASEPSPPTSSESKEKQSRQPALLGATDGSDCKEDTRE